MDAVLAVSALAMASAVAWADWVMSCCGVSSVAMSQIPGPHLSQMVRNDEIRKMGGHKTLISQKLNQIGLKFTQHLPGGVSQLQVVPPHQHQHNSAIIMPSASLFAIWDFIWAEKGFTVIFVFISPLKLINDMERYSLLCSLLALSIEIVHLLPLVEIKLSFHDKTVATEA